MNNFSQVKQINKVKQQYHSRIPLLVNWNTKAFSIYSASMWNIPSRFRFSYLVKKHVEGSLFPLTLRLFSSNNPPKREEDLLDEDAPIEKASSEQVSPYQGEEPIKPAPRFQSPNPYHYYPPYLTFPLHIDNPYNDKWTHPPVYIPKNKRKTVPTPRYGITKEIFLYKIGKNCYEYKDKFESWDKVFTLNSKQMKKLGIPTKQRRWILRWTEKYRQGVEPYSIRFKSISTKNKRTRLEKQKTHKALNLKAQLKKKAKDAAAKAQKEKNTKEAKKTVTQKQ